jgi:hypothetical protein
VSARWVPRMLTLHHHVRVQCCVQLFGRLWWRRWWFHSKNVTGDETWDCHYDPESNQSVLISFGYIMLTVNNKYGKNKGKSQSVLLLHDNVPVYTTKIARDALRFRSYEEIEGPLILYWSIKKIFRGRHFKDNNDLNAAVNEHFSSKSSDYY